MSSNDSGSIVPVGILASIGIWAALQKKLPQNGQPYTTPLEAIGYFFVMFLKVVLVCGVGALSLWLLYLATRSILRNIEKRRALEKARVLEREKLLSNNARFEQEISDERRENYDLRKTVTDLERKIKQFEARLKTPEEKSKASEAQVKKQMDSALEEILGGGT